MVERWIIGASVDDVERHFPHEFDSLTSALQVLLGHAERRFGSIDSAEYFLARIREDVKASRHPSSLVYYYPYLTYSLPVAYGAPGRQVRIDWIVRPLE